MEKPKSPKKPGGRTKRNSNRKSVESGEGGLANSISGIVNDKKRSPGSSGGISGTPKKSPSKEHHTFETIPDSFRFYRAQDNRDLSDSDESHMSFTESTCSSCSAFSDSGTGSDCG